MPAWCLDADRVRLAVEIGGGAGPPAAASAPTSTRLVRVVLGRAPPGDRSPRPATATPDGYLSRPPGTTASPTDPGVTLRRRWDAAPAAARARGDSGNRRLQKRWATFDARSKKPTIACVAIARELAGWTWSLATLDSGSTSAPPSPLASGSSARRNQRPSYENPAQPSGKRSLLEQHDHSGRTHRNSSEDLRISASTACRDPPTAGTEDLEAPSQEGQPGTALRPAPLDRKRRHIS